MRYCLARISLLQREQFLVTRARWLAGIRRVDLKRKVIYAVFLHASHKSHHQWYGHESPQGTSQIGKNHHQQNPGHFISPKAFDGEDVGLEAFNILHLRFAGDRLDQARDPSGGDQWIERSQRCRQN